MPAVPWCLSSFAFLVFRSSRLSLFSSFVFRLSLFACVCARSSWNGESWWHPAHLILIIRQLQRCLVAPIPTPMVAPSVAPNLSTNVSRQKPETYKPLVKISRPLIKFSRPLVNVSRPAMIRWCHLWCDYRCHQSRKDAPWFSDC